MYTAWAWADKKVHSVSTNGALWKVVLEGLIAVFDIRLKGVREQSSYGSILELGIRKSWTFESTDVRKDSSTPELHLVSQITCAENNLWTFPYDTLFCVVSSKFVLGGDEWCVGKNALGSGLYGGLDTKRAAGQCPLLTTVSVRCCCLFHVSL